MTIVIARRVLAAAKTAVWPLMAITVFACQPAEQAAIPSANGSGRTNDPADLIRAIDIGDVTELGRLLKAGADPNASPTEWTPLVHAIRARNRTAVTLLVKAGADLNRGDVTALAAAAATDDPALVDLLVAAGADPNGRFGPSHGWTPLMWAALWDSPFGMSALASHGARLNDWNLYPEEKYKNGPPVGSAQRGRTALMVAASRGHLRSVYRLLELGADPTLRNEDGDTALSMTREYRSPIIKVREILKDPSAMKR
jgi:ankyrin repeat protein